jgi:NOL1/NOP2/fmu family ribosome biogenesis protein
MEYIKILTEHEKKKIEQKLNEQFGIKGIPGKIVMRGAERLSVFTGNADEKEIRKIEEIAPIEKAGVYFAKLINEDIKLTIEGTQILQEQIKKGIFEINDGQAEEWMMGRELNIKTGLRGFVVMKNRSDLLGCGKASENKITNFIPKSRRLKNRG